MIICPVFLSFTSKEQQRPMKTMSMWEQKASQLRRQNQASCEALYEPDQSAYLPSALHSHPEMKTHLDRPLVVGHCDLLGSHQHHCHKPCTSVEAETAADPPLTSHHPHSHYHNRDKDWTEVNNETNNNFHGSKDRRHHVHHNRSKDHESNRGKEEKSERSHSKEGGRRHHRRRHHYQGSVDNSAGVGATSEKEHHRNHSHRQSRGGNGTVSSGGIGEQRSCPKDGSNSDRSTRGDSRANGQRRRHRTHGSRCQSKDEGEESDDREKIHTNRYNFMVVIHSLNTVTPLKVKCGFWTRFKWTTLFHVSVRFIKSKGLDDPLKHSLNS